MTESRNARGIVTGVESVGEPMSRVDGRLKVTGSARYSAEFPAASMVHAVIVQSTIARGRVTSIDASAASKVPGVLEVLTHENAPRLPKLEVNPPATRVLTLLQDAQVRY
ncbi:MAG: hypothetical protein ACHQRK_09140, partial [Gemmatimonadales bacterium]